MDVKFSFFRQDDDLPLDAPLLHRPQRVDTARERLEVARLETAPHADEDQAAILVGADFVAGAQARPYL